LASGPARRYRYAKAQRGGFTGYGRALELDACIIESKFELGDCWIARFQTASGISLLDDLLALFAG